MELARELSAIFKPPNKSTEEYSLSFYSPFRKGKNGKVFQISGCLYDKYLNLRRKLLALKIISKEDALIEGIKRVTPNILTVTLFFSIHQLYIFICIIYLYF